MAFVKWENVAERLAVASKSIPQALLVLFSFITRKNASTCHLIPHKYVCLNIMFFGINANDAIPINKQSLSSDNR